MSETRIFAATRKQAWIRVHDVVGKTMYLGRIGPSKRRVYVSEADDEYIVCYGDELIIFRRDNSKVIIEILYR